MADVDQTAYDKATQKTDKPKAPKAKKATPASTVHDTDLSMSIADARTSLEQDRDAIMALGMAHQRVEMQNLYLQARLNESQNFLGLARSVSYLDLSDRATKKTAHILKPVQAQNLLPAASDSQPRTITADEWLNGLDDDE